MSNEIDKVAEEKILKERERVRLAMRRKRHPELRPDGAKPVSLDEIAEKESEQNEKDIEEFWVRENRDRKAARAAMPPEELALLQSQEQEWRSLNQEIGALCQEIRKHKTPDPSELWNKVQDFKMRAAPLAEDAERCGLSSILNWKGLVDTLFPFVSVFRERFASDIVAQIEKAYDDISRAEIEPFGQNYTRRFTFHSWSRQPEYVLYRFCEEHDRIVSAPVRRRIQDEYATYQMFCDDRRNRADVTDPAALEPPLPILGRDRGVNKAKDDPEVR